MLLDPSELRQDYDLGTLDEQDVPPSPMALFSNWFKTASEAGLIEPNAMALATVGPSGKPSLRMVLLKGFNDRHLQFFTNYESRKAQEIAHSGNAALLFWWDKLQRQVRIEGKIEKLPEQVSTDYFNARPLSSRVGAIVSPQSRLLENREALEADFQKKTKDLAGSNPKRPDYWGGYGLIPEYWEFWQGRRSRLHDRVCYQPRVAETGTEGWEIFRLAP